LQVTLVGGVFEHSMDKLIPRAPSNAQALSTAVWVASSAVVPTASRHCVCPRNVMHASQVYSNDRSAEATIRASIPTVTTTPAIAAHVIGRNPVLATPHLRLTRRQLTALVCSGRCC
jgi:hypothetical protein